MNLYTDTHVGLKRSENQDRVFAKQICGDSALVILCDGMGGEKAGSYAAQTTIDVMSERITAELKDSTERFPPAPLKIKNALITALNMANNTVFNESVKNIERRGMGTTCAAGIITPRAAYLVNVGDSRIYHIHGDSLVQISRDHTYIQRLIDAGRLTEDEAIRHPQRNCITKAVGGEEFIVPDFFTEEIYSDSIFMFCSDGLHGYVPGSEIARSVGAESVENICSSLVEISLSYGGYDNVSVASVVV